MIAPRSDKSIKIMIWNSCKAKHTTKRNIQSEVDKEIPDLLYIMEGYKYISFRNYTSYHLGDKYHTQVLIKNDINHKTVIKQDYFLVSIGKLNISFKYFPPNNTFIAVPQTDLVFGDFNLKSNKKLNKNLREWHQWFDSRNQLGAISKENAIKSYKEKWIGVSDHPVMVYELNNKLTHKDKILNDISKPNEWKPKQFFKIKSHYEHILEINSQNIHKLLNKENDYPFTSLDGQSTDEYKEYFQVSNQKIRKKELHSLLVKKLYLSNEQVLKGSRTLDIYGFNMDCYHIDKVLNVQRVVKAYESGNNAGRFFFLRKDKDERISFSNSRPIQIIPTHIKIIERTILYDMHSIIERFMKGTRQFGFRRNMSTIIALKEMQKINSSTHISNLVSFDIRKAYDSVDIGLLTKNLWQLVRSKDEEVIIKFVVDELKSQHIALDGTIYHRGRGLPQGSTLSPLLFNFYLEMLLKDTNVNKKLIKFADDMLGINMKQEDIVELEDRLRLGNLKINARKTMYVGNYILDCEFQKRETVRWLGWFIYVENGSFKTKETEHINMFLPWNWVKHMDHRIKRTVINQYLYPKLDYALQTTNKAKLKTKAITSYFKTIKAIYGVDYLSYKDLKILGHDRRGLFDQMGDGKSEVHQGIMIQEKLPSPICTQFKINEQGNMHRLRHPWQKELILMSTWDRFIKEYKEYITLRDWDNLLNKSWRYIKHMEDPKDAFAFLRTEADKRPMVWQPKKQMLIFKYKKEETIYNWL